MKQLVNTKDGLKEIEVTENELLKEVSKNYVHEQWAEYVLKDGTKVHVASSGVIISDEDWEDENNVDYSKNMSAKLTPDGQKYKLIEKEDSVHRIVAEAFYRKYYGDNYSFEGKHVHHKDNNSLNNQLWNLIVLDSKTHGSVHGRKDDK